MRRPPEVTLFGPWAIRLLQACEGLRSLREDEWLANRPSRLECVEYEPNEPDVGFSGTAPCIDSYSHDQRDQMCEPCRNLLEYRLALEEARISQRAIIRRIVTCARRLDLRDM